MGMMRMKPLGHRGRFFWAARSEGFVKPGLYGWTGETPAEDGPSSAAFGGR
jgi:hypothetical protein